jgi:hypothetical protein
MIARQCLAAAAGTRSAQILEPGRRAKTTQKPPLDILCGRSGPNHDHTSKTYGVVP